MASDNQELLDSLSPSSIQKIRQAVEVLEQDPNAPHEVTISIRRHVHQHFPKMLYRGSKQSLIVKSDEEQEAAEKQGFSPVAPKPKPAKE